MRTSPLKNLRKERNMVDLHVHSTCSDGTFTPEELVDYAIQKGLTAFALTDHDTVNGLDRAIRYAEELRQAQAASPVISSHNDADDRFPVSFSRNDAAARLPVSFSRNDAVARLPVSSVADADVPRVPEIIPGIELSTEYQGKDIHMVGLFIDYRQPEFARYLEDFIRSRENRNKKMCVLLREHDIDITYEALLAELIFLDYSIQYL